ncbi:MAG: alpha/beta fold hydrolase [Candidatus Hermodarchaeota archaeon]
MYNILTKQIPTQFGNMVYYRSINEMQEILFIHGLGLNKEWFPHHYNSYSLHDFSWIIPDLIGHGKSAKPRYRLPYTMDQQAQNLLSVLVEEEVKEIVIMAHSMGGPIAISLIEQLMNQKTSEIKPVGLFYLEGNLDSNDAFISSRIAALSFEEFEKSFESILRYYPSKIHNHLREMGPYPLWASSLDIVSISKANQILPRLQKYLNFPTYFVFGEKNKGHFTSETLIKQAQLPLVFIPKAGHFMYNDNPDSFWKVIKQLIHSLDSMKNDN